MDISLTEERRMLQDSLRRTLAREPSGPGLWSTLAELGAGAAVLPEDAGGFGGTGADIALVATELGRAGAGVPMIDSVLLGAGVLHAAGGFADLVEALANGTARAAVADLEPGRRYDSGADCRAKETGDHWQLTGRKSPVVGGADADWLIVTAQGTDGPGLWLVQADAPGLSRRPYPLMDGGEGADIEFASTPARCLGGATLLDRPIAAATLAVCADAVGTMDRVLEMTAEYLRTRKQFGQPIGKFQALAHRMADLLIEAEQARSAVANLAEHLDAAPAVRMRYLSAAKVTVGEAAVLVAEESIQMHGGIGLTQEYGLGPLVRRLLAADARFGDADYHLERFARLSQSD